MSLVFATVTGWNPFAVAGIMVLGTGLAGLVLPHAENALMAVTAELWTKDIVGNLFKNNDWARRAFNADMYVINGTVVHIPVAGAPSTVTKNLAVFPAVAVQRTDTDITYALDTFYSTPRHIKNIDQYELAYDKRQSAMGEDQSAIIQTAMDSLLFRWAPAVANAFATTGAAVPTSLSGATGTRKAFTKDMFLNVKKKMDAANIPYNDRIAVLTADHYNDFLNNLSDAERTDVGKVADLKTGKVGMYLGIEIYMRSAVLRYRGASFGASVVVDELDIAFAPTATDRAASIFYQQNAVERSLGEVKFFERADDPLYYGDVYSYLVRVGGRQRRAAGVYAIVDDL